MVLNVVWSSFFMRACRDWQSAAVGGIAVRSFMSRVLLGREPDYEFRDAAVAVPGLPRLCAPYPR